MSWRRLLFCLLTIGLAAQLGAEDAKPVDDAKPAEETKPKRGFFSGIFKKDSKKEEPKKEEPPATPPASTPETKTTEPAKQPSTPGEKDKPKPEAPPPPQKEKTSASTTAKSEPPPEPKPKPKPKAETKPKPETKPEASASATPKPQSNPPPPKLEPKEQPKEAKPEPKPQPPPPSPPEPKPEPRPEPKPEPKAETPPPAPAVNQRDAAMAQIRDAIREAAAQVERVRKRRGLDTSGITGKVEAVLARPQTPQLRRTFRVQRALETLRRPAATFQFTSRVFTGGRGFAFDDSEDGRQSVIDELYLTKAEGTREIERLLQLTRLWEKQSRGDQAEAMAQRAILAARQLVKERPKDANAHALLAESLRVDGDDARPEMLQEIDTALTLEPNQPRALLARLVDQTERLREQLLREGPRDLAMPARNSREVLRRLYAQPPDDIAVKRHEAAAAEISRQAALVIAHAPNKPEFILRASAALLVPALNAEIVELARRNKARDFDQFEAMVTDLEAKGALARMEKIDWIGHMQKVLDAADNDGQMIAVVSAIPVLWIAEGMPKTDSGDSRWMRTPEKYRQMFERGMDRAAALGRTDDTVAAAKACEAVACLEFASVELGTKVRHEGMALRAIRLDPWRIHAIDLLTATLSGGFPDAAEALAEIRAAAAPTFSSYHRCAAAADKAEDWPAAQRHLETCLKLKPDDVATLSDLIAVRLCGDQSPERFAEVEKRFEVARRLYAAQESTLPPSAGEALVANYVAYLCLKEDWKSAAEVFAVSLTSGRLSQPVAKELASLIQNR